MDGVFEHRVEAIAAEAIAERAALAGQSLDDEVASVRAHARPLSVAEKLALSERLRAMTPADCLSDEGTLIVRWYRDTQGGRWTDDGWTDDDRR